MLNKEQEEKRQKAFELALVKLGEKLDTIRVEKELSQERLSAASEMSREHLRAILQGRVNVSLSKLVSLCNTLDIDAGECVAELQAQISGAALQRHRAKGGAKVIRQEPVTDQVEAETAERKGRKVAAKKKRGRPKKAAKA